MAIKINYKGTNCRGTTFEYRCTECYTLKEVTHPAADEPTVTCACGANCKKNPTVVHMDADHHDSMKFHNLGWDEDA